MQSCQSSKTGLYLLYGSIVWNTEILVEIAALMNLPVCFIDGVKKVYRHDANIDAPAVLNVQSGAWLRFGVSNAYGEVIPQILQEACSPLTVALVYYKGGGLEVERTSGRNLQAIRERNCPLDDMLPPEEHT